MRGFKNPENYVYTCALYKAGKHIHEAQELLRCFYFLPFPFLLFTFPPASFSYFSR
jgi:hypothetical protein